MKKITIATLALSSGLLLTACGNSAASKSEPKLDAKSDAQTVLDFMYDGNTSGIEQVTGETPEDIEEEIVEELEAKQTDTLIGTDWMDELRTRHPEGDFIFIIEGVLMYFYEKQVKAVIQNIAGRFGGGELWFDVCGTMMSRHGVKPDSLRKHAAQIRSGITDGHIVEKWEPRMILLEQANYMKYFRSRWGFFFGQVLGRMPGLCYKFSSMLGYRMVIMK